MSVDNKIKIYNARNVSNTRSASVFTVTEILLYFALVLNLLYSLFYSVYTKLHSSYHIIIFAFTIAIYVTERYLNMGLNMVFGVVAFFGLTLVAIFLNHSGVGLIINILWPLTIIYLFKNSKLTSRYLKRIRDLMFGGWIIALISTFAYNEEFFGSFETGIGVENINPNTMAIIIVFTSLFMQVYVESTSKSELIKLLISLLSLIALYRAKSRTSILAFVIVLMIEFVVKKRIKKSKSLGMAIPIAIITAGTIFPFAYTLLFTREIISYNALFLGKRIFTGRQYIWLNLWEYLQQHKSAWLWGVGYNAELYSRGTFNMHNAYLSIFAQYGSLLCLCWIWYIVRSIRKMYNKSGNISDLQFKCYQIVVYVLIVGFGEGVLTYLPNMIFIAMAIGIGNREK